MRVAPWAILLPLALGVAACELDRPGETLPPATPAVAAARPGSFFVEKGCTSCHAVAAYGLVARQPTGPDLSLALEDTPRKFGVGLREFLERPRGTMQKVLSEQIRLSEAERATAYEELAKAWLAHRTRQLPPPSPR